MKKSVVREYFEALAIAVVLALFVRTWVFQAFKIPTGSMEPNLLVGDHLIVNKMIFAPGGSALERALLPRRDIRRGDILPPQNRRVTPSRVRPACRATSSSYGARSSTSTARRSTSPARASFAATPRAKQLTTARKAVRDGQRHHDG
jgi:hypothetical protein